MDLVVFGDQIWVARYSPAFLFPMSFPSPYPSASKHTPYAIVAQAPISREQLGRLWVFNILKNNQKFLAIIWEFHYQEEN